MADNFQETTDVQPPSPTPDKDESGNGGNLGSLFNGVSPYNSEQAKGFNEAAHKLKGPAQSGGFAINEAGFTEYTKLCDKFIDTYKDMKVKLFILTQNAPLGDFSYANDVATFNVRAATTGDDSLIPNLDLMNDGYKQAREALMIARKNYDETESENNKRFAKLRNELNDSTEFNDRIDPIS